MAVLALNTAPARSSEGATANDTARFLAGLPPSSNSPLASYTKDPVWQQHARYFDSIFAREENAKLSKVREFSNKYLTDKHDTMLYMFSGPDFLYATSFFPNASTYVLAGLEPVGEIADLTTLSPWAINGELRNLELSMDSLFNFSFFITQNMKTQLREGPVNGTLPILYVFLARTGKTIHELNLVSLDEHGNFQIAAELAATNSTNKPVTSPPRSAATGVKIIFSDGAGPKQTLYYFTTNLADGSFERSGFSAFLAKLGPADSLIKSASYLLHKGHFASVQKLLLNSSATILQDDSGIPLAYFEARKWRFQAFGHYAGPISIFTNFYQPQMAELFKGARPIEFGIGYRWRKNESNLLLAQKESSPINDAELTPPSRAEGNAAGTAAPSPKKTRKRVETEGTRSAGCRIARVFPFCW
ncbi:MAG TPA: hypothetical protein VNY06_07625 [Methylocella sp.]|nr:hypothetical protein [Methylocella sp.]